MLNLTEKKHILSESADQGHEGIVLPRVPRLPVGTTKVKSQAKDDDPAFTTHFGIMVSREGSEIGFQQS